MEPLSLDQVLAAQSLRKARPTVVPGTRAIINRRDANVWHTQVTDAMRLHDVKADQVNEFCDIAGVAD